MRLHASILANQAAAGIRQSCSVQALPPVFRTAQQFDSRRSGVSMRSSSTDTQTEKEPGSNGSGMARNTVLAPLTPGKSAIAAGEALAEGALTFVPPTGGENSWRSFRLAFALPWRRFSGDSVLVFKLEGDISDLTRGRFDKGLSVPQLCAALQKAALDPRVKGLCVEIGPLAVGWGKLQEIRRYLAYFRASGKYTIAYMKLGGEKEYYMASAFEEIYCPPSASVSMRGFAVSGTFLRGVLDKIGVEPQVKRIGVFKSAGDQLLRRDMSEAQREQLTALLDGIYREWVGAVAAARGKTQSEVETMLNKGIFDVAELVAGGWLTGLKYEDEVIDDLKVRTGGKDDQVRKVTLQRYQKVSPSVFGLTGKKKVVVLRTSGAIVGKASGTGSSIVPDDLIPQLRTLAKDKNVAAIVLRVDSPGGDALASDLMWREIRKLAAEKPVICSMADVAASGGYYMAMACTKIVAESLTITGSIGVVTGKFNLAGIFEKIGYTKTVISRGRYAELLTDQRPFSGDEAALFDASATNAYESFRNKAAASRGMNIEQMQAIAQGRIWTGTDALARGLIDAVGGVSRAVAIAKQAAGIPQEESVTIVEMGRAKRSPLALLGLGASVSASLPLLALLVSSTQGVPLSTAMQGLSSLVSGSNGLAGALPMLQPGQISYSLEDVDVVGLGSVNGTNAATSWSAGGDLLGGSSSSSGGGGFFVEEEGEGSGGGVGSMWESVVERLL
ncbi:MAG: hypothetical protein WDW36_000957 [Sanguina aurantia]